MGRLRVGGILTLDWGRGRESTQTLLGVERYVANVLDCSTLGVSQRLQTLHYGTRFQGFLNFSFESFVQGKIVCMIRRMTTEVIFVAFLGGVVPRRWGGGMGASEPRRGPGAGNR